VKRTKETCMNDRDKPNILGIVGWDVGVNVIFLEGTADATMRRNKKEQLEF
jgi:hypothetical protein